MNVEDVIVIRCWCDPAALHIMYPVSKPTACGEIRPGTDAIVSVTWTILTNTITLHYFLSLFLSYTLSLFLSLFSICFLFVWDPQCENLMVLEFWSICLMLSHFKDKCLILYAQTCKITQGNIYCICKVEAVLVLATRGRSRFLVVLRSLTAASVLDTWLHSYGEKDHKVVFKGHF